MTFDPSGTVLASGSEDGTIRLWDVSTLQEIMTVTDEVHFVNALKFNTMGTKLAVANSGGYITLWDTQTYETLAVYKQANSGAIYSIFFSMDDELLASIDQSGIVQF